MEYIRIIYHIISLNFDFQSLHLILTIIYALRNTKVINESILRKNKTTKAKKVIKES